MEEITSVNNQLVKDTAKLHIKKYRDAENKFILEGYKAIEEAVRSGINVEYVFINSAKIENYEFYNGRKISTCDAVLKKISDTESAPEAVGVAEQKKYKKSDFKNLKKVVLLEGIKDLGNLGTIIRTACAFNIDGIVLYGNSTDMYSPKCVRSAVGNLWKIPIVYLNNLKDLEDLFADYQRIATLPLAKNTLGKFKSEEKLLLMFGSEADGLSAELKTFATDSIKIEMSNKVESLNLAISCGILMYYLSR